MREVKFRGKDSHGKWHYGCVVPGNKVDYDIYVPEEEEYHRVLGETIGQYTGLKDTNSNEIYEGDVVNVECHYTGDVQGVNCEPYIGVVTYDAKRCVFCVIEKGIVCHYFIFDGYNDVEINILGNIFDNPELIEKNECN